MGVLELREISRPGYQFLDEPALSDRLSGLHFTLLDPLLGLTCLNTSAASCTFWLPAVLSQWGAWEVRQERRGPCLFTRLPPQVDTLFH